MKYKVLYKPKHPNAYKNGQIPEHRYIMSQYLGKPLKKFEWVHHKNGNTFDNRIENLELTTQREHPKIHLTGKPLPKWHREKLSKAHLGQKVWNRGIPMSKKSKQKLSNSLKGKIPWNKGLKGKEYREHFEKGMKGYFKKGMTPFKTAYKKGHTPWSKGKKGICLNTGRTHFKKGHIPWNKKSHS